MKTYYNKINNNLKEMVFQDYELIPTKRVNKDRRSIRSIFFKRLFLASGGYSTLYLSTFAVYATHLHY